MSGRLASIIILFVTLSIQIGCAGDSTPAITSSPITPEDAPVGMLNGANSVDDFAGRYLWGIYEIILDPVSGNAEVVPQRIAGGHLNALRFLEVSPCDTCLVIANSEKLGPTEWMLDIRLSHPFVGLDRFTGFDVRGIVMFDPSFTFPGCGLSFPDPSDQSSGALLNAEGYTTLFNPVDYPPGGEPWPAWEYQQGKLATPDFPGSTLNPYMLFGVDKPRRFFGCTQTEIRPYHVRFPSSGPLRLGYAIDANWAPPLENPPVVPDDFPITANSPEPFKVEFNILENTLWAENGVGGGGHIRFGLKVYDHQDPRLISDGGTIESFKWEIDGMTGWDTIQPVTWTEGADSTGEYVEYEFMEAPVPDVSGPHICLMAVNDQKSGIKGLKERSFLLTEIQVNEGETCWSPGELLSDSPSENYESHLNNAHCTYVDNEGKFHLYYLDPPFQIHHLVYNGVVESDEIILPGEKGFNINAVPDSEGAVHLVYANDPSIRGGDIVYRRISPSGDIDPAVKLNSTTQKQQFEISLTLAPDGNMLVLWMDTANCPHRRLAAAYFNGSSWMPEMTFASCYIPDGWLDASAVADSSSVFHITYCSDDPINLYYLQFDHGVLSGPDDLIIGPQRSDIGIMSIDENDRIYTTFEDRRTGDLRGWFTMRDPLTGEWTPEIDMVGYKHYNNRYQNSPLPDGRLAVIWTDRRDLTRGLYCKVFDPFLSEAAIQAIPDDEIDAPFEQQKNQTRLCVDPEGTLHLVWSDYRQENHWQLYYSTCTP